jgi:aldehyde:ferredoxin oxidoreductase
MNAYGYTGAILHVDLTTKKIEKRPLDLDMARQYLGGLGLNFRLGYDLIKPGIDPLSPENPIILGAGPLVGTIVPGASRVYSLTKLPTSGGWGWGGGGGMEFGCMLKNAGYDHIIIEGRSDRPVYLKVFDDDVELCDAQSLWGLGSGETVDALRKRYPRPLGVTSIGPGGENQVKFAMAFIDKLGTLGRGGLAAVMGSKNLKAIAAKGTQGVKVADRKEFRRLFKGLYERIRKYPGLKRAHKLGFLNFMPAIPEEEYLKIKKARLACIGCPIGDKDLLQATEGRFKGLNMHTTSVNIMIPQIYSQAHDYNACMALLNILDEHGLDMFETFGLLEFADNLYKNGMLTKNDLGSEGIDFDDFDELAGWFDRIAMRQGFGAFLAEGFSTVMEKYSNGIDAFEPCVSKGQLAYQGIRGPVPSSNFSPFEMTMAVLPRGPASAPGGSSPLYFTFERPLQWIQGHFDRMGIPRDAQERILTEKDGMVINVGRLTKYAHQFLYAMGSLGLCGRGSISRLYSNQLHAELYTAATGFETSPEELSTAIERGINLEKAANFREGFTRKDDRFPERWFEEPLAKDYYNKVDITKEIALGQQDDYYDEMGWDQELGIPTRNKLLELGLDFVVDDIEERGLECP